ncbi:MAG: hypothetical protein K2F67_05360, partial [Eubacterium sp.]|nr:hypothetical protein [Eubacterium sp.]
TNEVRMKRKTVFVLAVIFCISLTGCAVLGGSNQSVSDRITDYCDKIDESQFEISLSDFTNFEWDYVIIYDQSVTAKEISEYAGINYEKALDLQSGMIFVKDNKIVFEEFFKTDFESPYPFVIKPYADVNSELHINKLSIDNATFVCEKIRYSDECRYLLKPLMFDKKVIADMALEYFIKNTPDVLDKEYYHAGGSIIVPEEYDDGKNITVEIRHVQDGINNTLDARYFINIYTARGVDSMGNSIDFTPYK